MTFNGSQTNGVSFKLTGSITIYPDPKGPVSIGNASGQVTANLIGKI